MKKITLLTLAVTASTFSFAQIGKGTVFTGGSAFISSQKDESTTPQQSPTTAISKTSNWGISPQVGKTFAENQIAGVFLRIGGNNFKQESSSNKNSETGTNYGGGVFYRRYYPLSQKFLLFGNIGLGFGVGSSERVTENNLLQYTSAKRKGIDFDLGVTPGLSWMVSSKLMLETSLNNLLFAQHLSDKYENFDQTGRKIQEGKRNQLNAGISANAFSGISLGIRWLIPRK